MSNPNNVFTNQAIDGTSAVFDGYSEDPVEVEVSVSGGVLSAGTIVSETSLDNVTWDTTSHAYSFTFAHINAGTIQTVAEGFPFIRFKLNGKATASGTPLVSCLMIKAPVEGSGPRGWSGFSGYSGSGVSGYSGYSGAAGSGSGVSGVSGYSGSVGTSGYSGKSGYSGSNGAAGADGASGYSGSNGEAGTSGYSGAVGTSGYSGPTGPTALVPNDQGSAYQLQASDVGKLINISVGGVTVPAAVFAEGDIVSIFNNSASPQTITQGSSATMYLTGTDITGNRTLAEYGICTLICTGSNTFVISGVDVPPGISGYSGVSGDAGTSGYSGYSGVSGDAGTSGYSGSGISGYSGAVGLSGYSGVNGTSGYSGATALVPNDQSAPYVLQKSDVGKLVNITTGGVTVNPTVFAEGDIVSIFNNSGSNQTITQGTSATLFLAGTATTGNRTLAQYGICTVICVAGDSGFVISGPGLT